MAGDAPGVFLHIGAMKTGTKYLQNLMEANADSLADAGYLFPVDGGWGEQVLATREVLHMTGDPRVRRRAEGSWQRLVDRMRNYDGNASVVSMEFLSFARRPGIERIMSSLEGVDTHIVLTVRDATRVIPAQWQTSVRNGHTEAWRDFAEQVMAGPESESDGYKVFRRAQDVESILERWLQFVPADHVHVVTVPPSSAPRTLLWERFASVLGVDPAACAKPPPTNNESIGQASAGLVRLVNLELGDITVSERSTVKTELANRILAMRVSEEPRARTSRALREFAAHANQQSRDAIASTGVDLVGDLGDLPVVAAHPPDEGPDELRMPTNDEYLEAAAFAIPHLHAVVDKRARRLRKKAVAVDDVLDRLPPPTETKPSRWADAADPLDAAVKELTAVVRVAIDLQQRIYALQDGKPIATG
ncbi:hypothetical protein [Solicola gregarius]|uniref:Sulfotransferase family protein n=1 Tax=Solicola gregarius TaxID=2908642 RepID=A0AA46TL41_9ACTN|nr:hypothetical protein [Solicola gregarius]UYM07070.1 hypothetical protein L0C25_08340 [Solicola gregarius]